MEGSGLAQSRCLKEQVLVYHQLELFFLFCVVGGHINVDPSESLFLAVLGLQLWGIFKDLIYLGLRRPLRGNFLLDRGGTELLVPINAEDAILLTEDLNIRLLLLNLLHFNDFFLCERGLFFRLLGLLDDIFVYWLIVWDFFLSFNSYVRSLVQRTLVFVFLIDLDFMVNIVLLLGKTPLFQLLILNVYLWADFIQLFLTVCIHLELHCFFILYRAFSPQLKVLDGRRAKDFYSLNHPHINILHPFIHIHFTIRLIFIRGLVRLLLFCLIFMNTLISLDFFLFLVQRFSLNVWLNLFLFIFILLIRLNFNLIFVIIL